MRRSYLWKCTVASSDTRSPLKVVISVALYGRSYCLEVTVHFDGFIFTLYVVGGGSRIYMLLLIQCPCHIMSACRYHQLQKQRMI